MRQGFAMWTEASLEKTAERGVRDRVSEDARELAQWESAQCRELDAEAQGHRRGQGLKGFLQLKALEPLREVGRSSGAGPGILRPGCP